MATDHLFPVPGLGDFAKTWLEEQTTEGKLKRNRQSNAN